MNAPYLLDLNAMLKAVTTTSTFPYCYTALFSCFTAELNQIIWWLSTQVHEIICGGVRRLAVNKQNLGGLNVSYCHVAV